MASCSAAAPPLGFETALSVEVRAPFEGKETKVSRTAMLTRMKPAVMKKVPVMAKLPA